MLDTEIRQLRSARTTLVKAVFDRFGKGPFAIDGVEYIVVVRTTKDGDAYLLQKRLAKKAVLSTDEAETAADA